MERVKSGPGIGTRDRLEMMTNIRVHVPELQLKLKMGSRATDDLCGGGGVEGETRQMPRHA
jgi:hypothetical protein